jgi:hypothetical protein
VRLLPALIFKRCGEGHTTSLHRTADAELACARRRAARFALTARLRTQAVHSLDVGQAYRLAATMAVTGSFNIAAAR